MKIKQFVLCAALVGAVSLLAGTVPAMPATADLPVYADALEPGWQDWSWDTTRNFNHTTTVHSGTASIAVTYTAGWGGLYLHNDAPLSTSDYSAIRFWVHGGSAGGQSLQFNLNAGDNYAFTAQANAWISVTVPFSSLGDPTTLGDLVWQNATNYSQPVVYLDDIVLVGSSGVITVPTTSGPALSVDAAADRHPISPYIYGINLASEAIAADLRLPVRRWGGNSTSRYNWQLDVHNTGSDWYYENIPDAPGTMDHFVEQDRRTGTETLLTMPLIGWTPKARRESHPYDCGFKVSRYGAQDSVDPWDTDCGNGEYNGNPLTGNDPHDTSVEITTTFVVSWINHLTGSYGTAANGGVMFYNLDNEPMLWNSTHRDVHPTPTTYDEMRDRTWAYAAAVKSADPTAKTLGPVVWGWCAYFYSAADDCSPTGPDHQAHGNTDFVEWYLGQARVYEQLHGVRILDYVDVHIYPQINGVYSEDPGSSTVQAQRLRSTRQLWDTTYVHEGWIGQEVYLIPRMKQWVANNYTGTQLAITEYNWGALGYMNGALAQADLLGIFGREGLDLATLWGPPDDANAPGIFAFRMYRNYDGQGSAFGETSLRATSADQDKVALYAAQRSSDGALTLMAINKTGQSLTSTLTLTNAQPAAAQVYRYSAANLAAIVHEANQPVAANGFTAVLPANSITLFILTSGAVTDLRVSSAVTATGIVTATDVLTAALRWTPPMNALTTTLRYSRTLITKANWASAALLTDTLPGAADIYTATVPYAGGVVYFALKPRNAVDESALSNNAFWPRREVYLPLVFK